MSNNVLLKVAMTVDAFINQEPSDIGKNFGSSIGEMNFILLLMMIMMIQMITSADRTAETPLLTNISLAVFIVVKPLLHQTRSRLRYLLYTHIFFISSLSLLHIDHCQMY